MKETTKSKLFKIVGGFVLVLFIVFCIIGTRAYKTKASIPEYISSVVNTGSEPTNINVNGITTVEDTSNKNKDVIDIDDSKSDDEIANSGVAYSDILDFKVDLKSKGEKLNGSTVSCKIQSLSERNGYYFIKADDDLVFSVDSSKVKLKEGDTIMGKVSESSCITLGSTVTHDVLLTDIIVL